MTDMAQVEGFDEDEDFYEDDEPIEKIRAAFERGYKGVTARPPVSLHGPCMVATTSASAHPKTIRLRQAHAPHHLRPMAVLTTAGPA